MPVGMSPSNLAKRQALLIALAQIDLPPGTKAIPLTKGKYALVDEADYAFLMQWNWRYGDGYARRTEYGPAGKAVIAMHNLILPSPDGKETDHKNHDGLDNRRDNLRPGTRQQNMWNRRKWQKPTSAPYKGVCWHKKNGYWQAQIKVDYKAVYLGVFATAEEAALAYNEAAIKYFGEFAQLNSIESVLV